MLSVCAMSAITSLNVIRTGTMKTKIKCVTVTHGKEIIMKKTLTTISLLIGTPLKVLNELTVQAQNELVTAYEANTENMDTVEIIEELKRIYVHHETEKLLSDASECFNFELELLHSFPESTISELLSVWESSNDLAEVYPIIQRELQISSLAEVSGMLGVSTDEIKEKYSYDTLSQLCGAYDMMSDEPRTFIIKELNAILEDAV